MYLSKIESCRYYVSMILLPNMMKKIKMIINLDWEVVIMRNNIIVAFSNEKLSNNISGILAKSGMGMCYVCSNFMEVRKQCAYLGGGILICGYKLADEAIISVIDDISERFNIMLIGNLSQLDLCDDEKVFKLAVPLKREDLLYSVTMLANMNLQSTYHMSIRKENEVKIIDKAKSILIDKYSMTEEQAHRYIQRKSMNTGVKMIDVAQAIVE